MRSISEPVMASFATMRINDVSKTLDACMAALQ
jgi:hypothetical protein